MDTTAYAREQIENPTNYQSDPSTHAKVPEAAAMKTSLLFGVKDEFL
jgi:hypothetical protein